MSALFSFWLPATWAAGPDTPLEDTAARIRSWGAWGVALLFGRHVPLIAFNLLNYAAALTSMSWWTFAWATGLGILPLTILLNVLGERMLTTPLWLWLFGAIVAGSSLILRGRWRHVERPPQRGGRE